MKEAKVALTGLVLCAALGVIGCAPSEDEMQAMLKQPPRPAELDRLEAFVGSWTADVEVKIPGQDETHKSSGRNTTQWSTDRWILVENWEHDMGENDTAKGVSLMWWDAPSKKYRMTFADNYGSSGTGTMKYNAKTDTWHWKGKSRDGKNGHVSVGKGKCKLVNPSTMEWTWTEYDRLGLFKMFELKGVSKRQ